MIGSSGLRLKEEEEEAATMRSDLHDAQVTAKDEVGWVGQMRIEDGDLWRQPSEELRTKAKGVEASTFSGFSSFFNYIFKMAHYIFLCFFSRF